MVDSGNEIESRSCVPESCLGLLRIGERVAVLSLTIKENKPIAYALAKTIFVKEVR